MAPTWPMPQQLWVLESSRHTLQSSSQPYSLRALCLSTAFPYCISHYSQASGDSSVDIHVGLRYTQVYSKYVIPNASYLANVSPKQQHSGEINYQWVGLQTFLSSPCEAVTDGVFKTLRYKRTRQLGIWGKKRALKWMICFLRPANSELQVTNSASSWSSYFTDLKITDVTIFHCLSWFCF
jgi:hypothetical protein